MKLWIISPSSLTQLGCWRVAFLLITLIVQAAAFAEESFDDRLRRLSPKTPVKFDATVTSTSSRSGIPFDSVVRLCYDPHDKRLTMTRSFPEKEFISQKIWQPSQFLVVAMPDGRTGDFTMSAHVADDTRSIEAAGNLGACSLLIGRFNNGDGFPKISDLFASYESSQTDSLVLIESTGGPGRATLTFDTANENALVRLTFSTDKTKKGKPQYEITYDVVEWKTIEGMPFPSRYRVSESWESYLRPLPNGVFRLNGRFVTGDPSQFPNAEQSVPSEATNLVYDVEVTEIVPKPTEADFQPLVSIPDATPVTVMESLQIPHIWRNGQVVPHASDKLDGLGNVEFIGAASKVKVIFVLIAIGLTGAALATYSRRTKRSRDVN